MKCNYCGHEYSHGNFCPNCGAANNIDASSQNGQQNYQPPAQPQFRQQNQYQNTYGSSPMIQRRSIATCIILTIVTCGIYGIFWFISLTDDTRALSNDFTGASGGTAFVYTLSLVASTDSTGLINKVKELMPPAVQKVLLLQIRVWFILSLQSSD